MSAIYHERQSLMYCAIHALNNLMQCKAFTKQQFDAICSELSNNYINPHKSMLGIGNYDINSIMKALESKDMTVIWYDKRREITKESIQIDESYGYIMNLPTDYTFGFITIPLIKSRHWISLRKVNDNYYNLDSKLDKPKSIGNEDDFVAYLKSEMTSNNKELFIIKAQVDTKSVFSS